MHIREDELRTRLAQRGLPPIVGDISVGLYRAGRAGEFATVDPMLEQLIGHPPTRIERLLR